jgi:hypothetical protein
MFSYILLYSNSLYDKIIDVVNRGQWHRMQFFSTRHVRIFSIVLFSK